MESHSKLFSKPIIKSFFEDLQAIAPEYLQWHETNGKIICIQQPIKPDADHRIVNTVEKVMKLLHLTIKQDEYEVHRYPDGRVSHSFPLKDIYDQLNTKQWIRKHVTDFAGINSEPHTRKSKSTHK